MQAKAGNLLIGGGAPVSVQTMYDSSLASSDAVSVVERITKLSLMGCDAIRFSYISDDDSKAFSYITSHSPIPVIADIHFDYKMAISAIENGAAKIRVNPGNIGAQWKTREVVKAASAHGSAIRIGLNSGSLPHSGLNRSKPQLMVETALEYISWFESWGFTNTVVSLKSTDIDETMEACRLFASLSAYPQHIGITEAGGPVISAVRSTWALGNLLREGIGNTLRISMSGSMEDEVVAGVELLRTLGLRKKGVRIISCPRCGRHAFDTIGFENSVRDRLLSVDKDITVAIMGCLVNGPGEARDADFAITGMKDKVYLFRHGELVSEINPADAERILFEAIENE